MDTTSDSPAELIATPSSVLDEVQETKDQYIVIMTGAYFIAGIFWVFSTVGSGYLRGTKDSVPFFSSMIALMLSNGMWEILTGWYADKFRRRFSISAGFFACGTGFLIMLLAAFVPFTKDPQAPVDLLEPRLLTWLVGITVWSFGPALLSGAQEAWFVDRCNFLSPNSSESLDDVFKKAARRGIIAKAAGCLCFFVLYGLASSEVEAESKLGFVLTAGIAAFASFSLFAYSRRLQEEYWSDPKYQTEESLFAFLWLGLTELCKSPYRWFTIAFIGATSLNYVLSFTVWPYVADQNLAEGGSNNGPLYIAAGLITVELLAGYLSRAFSMRVDRIKQPAWRMPVASLMFLLPVLPLYVAFALSSTKVFEGFLVVLILATFLFRTAHASVFGTLNAAGQQAIESDERRAVMVSMSSALAAFFVAAVLWLSYNYRSGIHKEIYDFWLAIILPSILMLAVGGYLIARRRKV